MTIHQNTDLGTSTRRQIGGRWRKTVGWMEMLVHANNPAPRQRSGMLALWQGRRRMVSRLLSNRLQKTFWKTIYPQSNALVDQSDQKQLTTMCAFLLGSRSGQHIKWVRKLYPALLKTVQAKLVLQYKLSSISIAVHYAARMKDQQIIFRGQIDIWHIF